MNTILVDMDGVLAGFDTEVQKRMQVSLPEVTIVPRQHFYIADDYPEYAKEVRTISSQPGFFAELPVEKGALVGLERILQLGFIPQICSSPLRSNPTCREDKLRWIEQHLVPRFGAFILETAIITKDKHEVEGVALIDDRPLIHRANEALWQHVVFDQPWNKNAQGIRLNGWLDRNLAAILDLIEQNKVPHLDETLL